MAYQRLDLKNGVALTEDHLKHIEDGIVAIENSAQTGGGGNTSSSTSNYWTGKKFVMNGDSIPYGSGLTNNKDAFPHLVAN
jgi:hypothetical protein